MVETKFTATGRQIRSERVGFSLTPADKRALEERAAEAGVATGMLVNLIVRAYLANPHEVLPGMPMSQE